MNTSNIETPKYYSFFDAKGVIFERVLPTNKDYPNCIFGTDFNHGFGLNIIRYKDSYTLLINCDEQDDGSSGIKSLVLKEDDEFNHFVREAMFELIYSLIKDSNIKFQVIVGGFSPDVDENWYGANDIKNVFKSFV